MSETKFTKGPWVRNYHANGCQYISAKTELNGCYSVASTHGPDDIDNAHLIAAAPEMYEELQEISNWMNSQLGMGDWHKDIEKLLAKARGEHV